MSEYRWKSVDGKLYGMYLKTSQSYIAHYPHSKRDLMGVAYLRDTGATTLQIVLASSEAGKGWSYCARVMRWHVGEYPVWVRILLSVRARPLGAAW